MGHRERSAVRIHSEQIGTSSQVYPAAGHVHIAHSIRDWSSTLLCTQQCLGVANPPRCRPRLRTWHLKRLAR